MTLWHRAPRQVYRVYEEDEYLGENASSATEDDWAPHVTEGSCASPMSEEPYRAPTHDHAAESYAFVERPLRRPAPGRLIGLGLLIGVIVSATALVALNEAHRSPAAPSATVAQAPRVDTVAHAPSGAPIAPVGRGSLVGVANLPALRTRAIAHPRTRGATHFSTVHPLIAHPSIGYRVTRHPSTTSESSSREDLSEPVGTGGQAARTGVEFGFER
jgi:hypothetical protein